MRVHPSQLLSPGGDKRAAEAAYRDYLAAEPENRWRSMGWPSCCSVGAYDGEALQIRQQRYAAKARRLGVPDEEIDSVVSFLAASLGDGAAPPGSAGCVCRGDCSMSFRAFRWSNRSSI